MTKKLFFILCAWPMLLLAQHSIKGNFKPATNYEFVILYKVTPQNTEYVANSAVNEQGDFEFQLDSTQSAGMYRLVYALPQEENNFDVIYNAKEDIEFNFNSETGIDFINSIENKLITSYTHSMGVVSGSIGNFFRQQSTDTLALHTIFTTQKQTQQEFEKAAEGTLALNFIKANTPYIPEEFQDIKAYIENLRAHFFDHIDFNNETLQSSNFLIERVLNYVFGMTGNGQDEIAMYKSNVDAVVTAMEQGEAGIQKILLRVLWQQMADSNIEEVANYITDNYLLDLAIKLEDTELARELNLYKSLSLGEPAPDFEFELETEGKKQMVKLSSYDVAEQYIIVFWSSTCGHCLKEIPLLYEYLQSQDDKALKVIAVGLEDEPFKWRSETFKYPNFAHVLGLGKWDNEIGDLYNVQSTPSYFVLDKDKKIVAKPYDFEALKKVLQKQ